MIETDLQGLVDRLTMSPKSHALQPLFEAVSNSLHAIQAAKRKDGVIRIYLTRNPVQSTLPLTDDKGATDRNLAEIIDIKVQDNGIGFSLENFNSFQRVGSRLKLSIGGKGVGRLTWLRAFQSVEISSVFQSSEGMQEKRLLFRLPDGVEIVSEKPSLATDTGTTVLMKGIQPDFAPYLRHRATTIASEITRHFLAYFLANTPPKIEIVDSDGEVIAVSLDDTTKKTRTTFDPKEVRLCRDFGSRLLLEQTA